jgi:hypothetical protein
MWGAQLEVGDIATDYIATTTTAVSVGPVANLPRLDYLNSTCPNLLLEPQRTNLNLQSENFSSGSYSLSASTITSNSVTSPDGYTNADTITASGSGVQSHNVRQFISTTAGVVYAYSVFVKKGTTDWVMLRHDNGGTLNYFNVNTGVKGVNCDASATIVNYGNGWYRCTVFHTGTGSNGGEIYLAISDGNNSFVASGQSLYIYGAQYEAGSYVTSYVPTLGAASTRGADTASKTGISSLIGQPDGTIYWESNQVGGAQFALNEANNVSSDGIQIYGSGNALNIYIQQGGIARLVTALGAVAEGTNFKIAVAYGTNFVMAYINGVQTYATTATIPIPTLTMLNLSFYGGGGAAAKSQTSEAILFPTRLSNAELAQLTTL